MKRHLSLLVCALVALCLSLGLVACGDNQQDLIREQVSAELDRVSDTSEENVRSLLGEEGYAGLQDRGLDPNALYAALFGRFSYEIGDVTVEKDVAQVSLTVTNVDIRSAINEYEAAVEAWASSDDAVYTFDQYGQEGLEEEVMRMLYGALTNPDVPTVTNDVVIEFRQDADGAWIPADGSQVTSALFAGADVSSVLG